MLHLVEKASIQLSNSVWSQVQLRLRYDKNIIYYNHVVELHKTDSHIRFGKNTHWYAGLSAIPKNVQLRKVYVKRLSPVTDAIIAKSLSVKTSKGQVSATGSCLGTTIRILKRTSSYIRYWVFLVAA